MLTYSPKSCAPAPVKCIELVLEREWKGREERVRRKKPRMLCLHHPVSRLVSAPDLTSGLNAQRWVDGLLPLLVSDLSTGWSELSRGEIGGWCSLSAPVSGKNCARSDEDGGTMGRGEGDVTRPRVRSLLW